jgi:hypothetical protein
MEAKTISVVVIDDEADARELQLPEVARRSVSTFHFSFLGFCLFTFLPGSFVFGFFQE